MVGGTSAGAATPGRPGPRVYLHLGAMKTGTTYLQQLMSENQDALAEAGFLFPGRTWTDQSRAARDALNPKATNGTSPWQAMAASMVAHEGEASVFSMEFLSFADRDRASRIVASLEGAEVHAVLTVRDTTTVLPAQWQTSCRNGGTIPWPRFVNGLRQALRSEGPPRSRPARVFQRTQGIVRMLEVWEPMVGAGRLHVVTVPPRGSDPRLLWQRFAGVVGVDPRVASRDPVSSNLSMGHASTEMLRLLNVEVEGLAQRDYERVVRGPLRAVLGTRSSQEAPIRLNRRGAQLSAEWNQRVRDTITERGIHLVGALSDLPIEVSDPTLPRAFATPDPAEVHAAAVAARDGLRALEADLRARAGEPATDTVPGRDQTPIIAAAELVHRCVALTHRLAGRDRVS